MTYDTQDHHRETADGFERHAQTCNAKDAPMGGEKHFSQMGGALTWKIPLFAMRPFMETRCPKTMLSEVHQLHGMQRKAQNDAVQSGAFQGNRVLGGIECMR
ncbi:hypothetical protein FF52_03150 [Flavobacterium sp. F52]|nr:hypothetical protein FF52_03150 [Flavobacterium sp. F52]